MSDDRLDQIRAKHQDGALPENGHGDVTWLLDEVNRMRADRTRLHEMIHDLGHEPSCELELTAHQHGPCTCKLAPLLEVLGQAPPQ